MNAPAPTMNTIAPSSRSTLVTVLAWILLVLAALSAYGAVMQVFFWDSLTELPPPAGVDPVLTQAAAGTARGAGIISVALSAFMMYASYALLRRRNWARRLFVVLFAIGIVANVCFVLMFGLGAGFLVGALGAAFSALFVVWAIFCVGVALLLGWLIKRLRSPAVKSEFASSAAAILIAVAIMFAGTPDATAQDTGLPFKQPGVIRIGLVKPKVQVGTEEAPNAADSVRNILAEYLQGPTIEVALLSARLPSQYLIEARQAECDYILASTLAHQRGGLTSKLGESLGKLAHYAPYVPGGGSVSSAVVSGVLLTAADFAASIKAKDVMRLEYRLDTVAADAASARKPLLEDTGKRKAKADGEDLLTPLVEGAAEAVGEALSKASAAAAN
jgi:hypothetical protein